MKQAERDKLRFTWREMAKNYRGLRATAMKVFLCKQATAEHVLPARQALCDVHASMMETQRKLEQLDVLGFADPRMNDIN